MEYKTLFKELITNVIQQSGSDLHLSEGRHPTVRVDGELVPLLKHNKLTTEDTTGLLAEMVDEAKIEKFKYY